MYGLLKTKYVHIKELFVFRFPVFAKRRQQKSIDRSDSTDQKVIALIDRYCNEVFDCDTIDSINPIDYWKEKQLNPDQQPLADIALDILSYPASSAGCERLFSYAGIATSGKRTCVGAETLENELMLRMNLDFVIACDSS